MHHFLWIFFLTAMPLPNQETADLERRIQALEQQLAADPIDRKDLNVFSLQQEKKRVEERAGFDKVWNRLDRRLGAMEDRWSLIFELLGVSAVSLIGLFFIYYWRAIKRLDKTIEKEFHARKEMLKSMITESDQERLIRENERLLVLTRDGTEILKALLRQRFKCVTPERVDPDHFEAATPEGVNEEAHDLIIFDNLDEKYINKYLKNSSKSAFMAYYTKPGHQDIEEKSKVNFAQSPITLYNGLIATARYRRLTSSTKA